MKYFFSLIVIMLFSIDANCSTIEMFGKKKYGFNQPIYITKNIERKKNKEIVTLANHDDFPFSSYKQGSVFSTLIEKIAEKSKVYLNFVYNQTNYKDSIKRFERGDDYINALFGVPKEYYPYSKNEYIYPAFFENKLHVITIRNGGVVINTKQDLPKYKGIFVKKDNLSSFIVKDLSNHNMTEVEDYSKAFEMLFTKKIDYIVAGYYPSQIEAYKIGVRNYISYSKEAIWKNPLFLRVDYRIANDERIKKMKKYMKTEEFKNIRDNALEEVLGIYKENTQGIVPPMYIGEDTNSN